MAFYWPVTATSLDLANRILLRASHRRGTACRPLIGEVGQALPLHRPIRDCPGPLRFLQINDKNGAFDALYFSVVTGWSRVFGTSNRAELPIRTSGKHLIN
jgi:hypothetical protein